VAANALVKGSGAANFEAVMAMARKVTKLQDADERFVRVIVGLHKLTQWAREAGITERDLIREVRRQRKRLMRERRKAVKRSS